MSGRMMRLGGTRRRRMATSEVRLTRTPAATAETHNPTGMKVNRTMKKRIATPAMISTVVDMGAPYLTLDFSYGYSVAFDPDYLDLATDGDEVSLTYYVHPLAIYAREAGGAQVAHRGAYGSQQVIILPRHPFTVRTARGGNEALLEEQRRSHAHVRERPQQEAQENAAEERGPADDGDEVVLEDAEQSKEQREQPQQTRYSGSRDDEQLQGDEQQAAQQDDEVQRTGGSRQVGAGGKERQSHHSYRTGKTEAGRETLDAQPAYPDPRRACGDDAVGEAPGQALGSVPCEPLHLHAAVAKLLQCVPHRRRLQIGDTVLNCLIGSQGNELLAGGEAGDLDPLIDHRLGHPRVPSPRLGHRAELSPHCTAHLLANRIDAGRAHGHRQSRPDGRARQHYQLLRTHRNECTRAEGVLDQRHGRYGGVVEDRADDPLHRRHLPAWCVDEEQEDKRLSLICLLHPRCDELCRGGGDLCVNGYEPCLAGGFLGQTGRADRQQQSSQQRPERPSVGTCHALRIARRVQLFSGRRNHKKAVGPAGRTNSETVPRTVVIFLAGAPGLEPGTYGFGDRRSTS